MLRAALAVMIGLAMIAVPAAKAHADGPIVAPVVDTTPNNTVWDQYSYDGGSNAVFVLSYDNNNDVDATVTATNIPSLCTYSNYALEYPDHSAAGPGGDDPIGAVVPAHATIWYFCNFVPAGTYTATSSWSIAGSPYESDPVTYTIFNITATKAAVTSITPDSGAGDGSIAVSLCAGPEKADEYASVSLSGSADRNSPEFRDLNGCKSVTFEGLPHGHYYVNSSGRNQPNLTGEPVIEVDVPLVASPGNGEAPGALSPTQGADPSAPSQPAASTQPSEPSQHTEPDVPTTVAPRVTWSAAPSVTGKPLVGVTVRATGGSVVPGTVAVSYQWLRSGSPINGATRSSYVLTPADCGMKVSVQVTGTLTGYAPATTISPAVKIGLGSGLSKIKPPTIKGSAKVDRTLIAAPGAWKPKAQKITYQWLRSGSPIKGAVKASYKVAKSDKGKRLSVRVTAMAVGYKNGSATSKVTAKVR